MIGQVDKVLVINRERIIPSSPFCWISSKSTAELVFKSLICPESLKVPRMDEVEGGKSFPRHVLAIWSWLYWTPPNLLPTKRLLNKSYSILGFASIKHRPKSNLSRKNRVVLGIKKWWNKPREWMLMLPDWSVRSTEWAVPKSSCAKTLL